MNQDHDQSPTAVRRSERTRKRPANYQGDHDEAEFAPAVSSVASSPVTKKMKFLPRRNPGRQAAAELKQSFPVPSSEEIQEKSFTPLSSEELEEWHGWTDVESEPVCGFLYWVVPTRDS
jgi:ubiquitin carboxyl-terminal hydrolase L5